MVSWHGEKSIWTQKMKAIESKIIAGLFAIVGIILCLYAFNLPSYSLELGDSINHYLYAKYAFEHPENFLDLWAKPLFVILSFPFAAAGIQAVYVFNIGCALATCFALYKSAQILEIEESWTIILLTVFTPVYFALIPTALTEVLCSMFLALLLYALLSKKYHLAAILASLLPFARQEGYLVLPIMIMLLATLKQYKSMPLLLLGILLYCVATYFMLGDALWFIQHHPYDPGKSVYGNGSLLHFVNEKEHIFGKYYFYVLVASIFLYTIVSAFKIIKKQGDYDKNIIVFLLLIGFPVGFFSIHSYIWWKGVSGSAGLIRVMGVIIPYCSLILAYGLSMIKTKVFFRTFLYYGFLGLFFYKMYMACFVPLYKNLSNTETQLLNEGIEKLELKKKQINGTLFCFDPYVAYALKRDPYNPSEIRQGWDLNREQPHISMYKNDLMIWDSHFYIPSITPIKDSLLHNDSLDLLYHKVLTDEYDSRIKHEVFIVRRR
jgi:hypothetical protein